MKKIISLSFISLSLSFTIKLNAQRVGIGSIQFTPTNTLDVRGPASVGTNYAGIATAAPTNGLLVEGNVGIGTTTTSYKLHTNGDVFAQNGWFYNDGARGWYNTQYGGGWYMTDATWVRTYNSKSVYTDNLLGSNGGLTVGYGGTSPTASGAIISGNVGIGSNNPGAKLDVTGNIRSSTFIGANGLGEAYGGQGGMNANYYHSATNDSWFAYPGNNYNYFRGNTYFGGDNNIWLTSGRVGIGTTSPSSLLHVEAYNSTEFLNGIAILIKARDLGTVSGQFTSTSPSDIVFQNANGTERMRIHSDDASSNVQGLFNVTTSDGLGNPSRTVFHIDRIVDGSKAFFYGPLYVNSQNNLGGMTSGWDFDVNGNALFRTSGGEHFGTTVKLKTSGGTDGPRLAFENYNGGVPKSWNLGIRAGSNDFGFFENGNENSFGTERMTVKVGGNVGINNTNPQYTLDVTGNVNISGNMYYCGGGFCASDIRYKKEIKLIEGALESVKKINGVNYYWRKNEFKNKGFSDIKQYGVIAQDLEKIFPEMVNTDKDGYKSVDYTRLIPILVEAVKELADIKNEHQKTIIKTEQDITLLKAELAEQKQQIKSLLYKSMQSAK